MPHMTVTPSSSPSSTPAPPTVDDVMVVLGTVIDPELGADIVSLGMVPSVDVAPDGLVTVGIKLTIGGCPLRAEIKKEVETRVSVHPGVSDVKISWGEMNAEERSRGDDQGPLERTRERPRHRGAAVVQGARHRAAARAAWARARSPSTSPLRWHAAGHTVGVLDADIWGFSVPRLLGISDRMEASQVDGVRQAEDHPQRTRRRRAACSRSSRPGSSSTRTPR